MTRILAIDAGFAAPGFAVVDTDLDLYRRVVYAECLVTKGTDKKKRNKLDMYKSDDDMRRIDEISDHLTYLVETYSPDLATIELPGGSGKGSAALKGMAFAGAVASVTMRRLGVPRVFVTPRNNKLHATGKPEAEKFEMVAAARAAFPEFEGWPRMTKYPARFDDDKCWAIADALCTVLAHSREIRLKSAAAAAPAAASRPRPAPRSRRPS